MSHYDLYHPGEAFDAHIHSYFHGHEISRRRRPAGRMEQREWTYLTSGCWKATARHAHGLEFVLSATVESHRHVELLTMLAYCHAGPESQRLDLGHTTPIGQPWTQGSLCDCILISRPYAYPELEICSWNAGHIRVLTAHPITAAERALKIDQGMERLEQRLEDTKADFANPQRPSVA